MATQLGVNGTAFTRNAVPTFLLGVSYYGALGASEATWRRDLDDLQRHGFNWIRVWATWAAFDNDVSAVEGATGRPREPFLGRLAKLLDRCDRRGMIVDVTLSRGNGVTGPPRLAAHEAHRQAVETLLTALKGKENWYLDLSNERNINDRRFTPMDELKALRETARRLDSRRLITASDAGDISDDAVAEYLRIAGVDFLSPHLPRAATSAEKTVAKSREILGAMKELGRIVPLHYQEPFRRGFDPWEPTVEDFMTDLRGAKAGGAAGWCFHNGHQSDQPDGRPRRSFDLREKRLFDQFDDVERAFLKQLPGLL